MAKRYDPILCMMVDEPAKAQDAKAKDKLVKVPDSKLKDFEANLRSAGFKVVSKSDRGKSTHYQVEVNSSKQFTESDLREWANKIDAVCDKMDSVAPTTWNIGLTADGKITAGLDVREMYVKDSASALDKSIKACDKDLPAFCVSYISGYAGGGVNRTEKEYFHTEHEANKRAAELKSKNIKGVSVKKYENFYHTKDSLAEQDEAQDTKAKDYNALDEAIKTTDGMFASAFGEYTKGAKFKKEKFLKELAGISDVEEFAKRMQTLDNELKKNLERLDEAYNVASKDYYDARNEIRSIMDAFSREAFSLYKKLDKK